MRQAGDELVHFSIASAALVLFFCYYLLPIWDMDFWWHIASGRWIVENRTIPLSDPFSVFANTNPIRTEMVLGGQWLGQVAFYQVFDIFGASGIIYFRALLLSGVLLFVYLRTRLPGQSVLVSLLALCLVGFNLFAFTGIRPQLLGFLLAAVLFYFVDRSEKNYHASLLFILAGTGLLWANCHGSFVLAVVLLLLYGGTLFIQAGAENNLQQKQAGLFLLGALLFMLFALINPNGITAYKYIANLQNSELQERTSEYLSALRIYTLGYNAAQAWIYLFFVLALLALPKLFATSRAKAALLVFLGAISVESFRYYVFFIIVCAPYIAQALAQTLQGSVFVRLQKTRARYFVVVVPLFVTFALLYSFYPNPSALNLIDDTRYPLKITDYLEKTNARGRVFNYFRWGGYLIWRLHPQLIPYIDGRMLDDSKLEKYTHMLWATGEGIPLFESANFDYVMIPYTNPATGEKYPLNDYLLNSSKWQLLYRSRLGYLFGAVQL